LGTRPIVWWQNQLHAATIEGQRNFRRSCCGQGRTSQFADGAGAGTI